MDWKSELYDVLFIALGLGLMMIAGSFRGTVLENLQWIGFAITCAGSFITDIVFEMITRFYTHFHIISYDKFGNKTDIHFYSRRGGLLTKTVKGVPNFFRTQIRSKWSYPTLKWGEIDAITIYHHLPWARRVLPDKGKAIFKGNIIDHAQSATLHCFDSGTSSDRYKDKHIPSVMLAFAPKRDSQFPVTIPQITSIMNKHGGNLNQLAKVLRSGKSYETMFKAFLEKTEEANYYHSIALQGELAEKSHKSETDALLKDSMDVEERAWSTALNISTKYDGFDKAVEARHGKGLARLLLNKWTVLFLSVVMGVIGFVMVVTNPEAVQGLTLSILQMQYFVLAMGGIACVCFVTWAYLRRKR